MTKFIIIIDVILVLPVYTTFLQPFCTHYYIDPQTNKITVSPDRNTQHILIQGVVVNLTSLEKTLCYSKGATTHMSLFNRTVSHMLI